MITKSHRYREILVVLARHGIGIVNDEFIKHEAGDQARAEHLRLACEDLGPMFIKLGQVLSTRDDLFPEVYRAELAKLQDEVPPLPESVIAGVIREDLDSPPELIFAFFDTQPLGSASIGQVHAARLFDGREVIVKVRKPGVDELVQVDLEILADLVKAWTPRFPVLEQYDARGLVAEFSDALKSELDYGREAANEKFFRDLFRHEHGFIIPNVIDEYSKNRVLTEERVKGRRATEVIDLPKPRRAIVSSRISRFVLEPAFEHGIFHADPHPGNLLVREDDMLCVIDFGKIGRLTPEQRRRIAEIFMAIERSDAERLTDHLIELTAPAQPIDRALVTAEIDRILALYVNTALKNVQFGSAVGQLLQLGRHYGLRLPGNMVQFFKTLAMSEGLLLTIDPESNFSEYLRPMAGKLVYQGFGGRHMVDRLLESASELVDLGLGLPKRIDRILGQVEQGNLQVWARIEDMEHLIKRLERLGARLGAAMLTAACVVGLALVIPIYHPQGWKTWADLVFWFVVVAVIIGSVKTLLGLFKK